MLVLVVFQIRIQVGLPVLGFGVEESRGKITVALRAERDHGGHPQELFHCEVEEPQSEGPACGCIACLCLCALS